jgi:hypothetical protein
MIYATVKEDLTIHSMYESSFVKDSEYDWPKDAIEGTLAHVPAPEGLDQDCLIAQQNGEVIELIEDGAKVAAKAVVAKQNLVTAAYDRMNADVLAEMKRIFNTSNPDSANRQHNTWKVMVVSPALYLNIGLKADSSAAEMNAGEEFTDSAKTVAWAQDRVTEAELYSVWCMQRIEQFRSERAAILLP